MKKLESRTKAVVTRYGLMHRCLGKVYAYRTGFPWRRDSVFADSERRFPHIWYKRIKKENIYHLMFFDTHYLYLNRWNKAPQNLIATIHHPVGRAFPEHMENMLRRLTSALVMYTRGIEYFERYVGVDRVKFVHYGVDTDFFCPGSKCQSAEKHVLFTGQNGRNNAMLRRVVLRLLKNRQDLMIDFLVPYRMRGVAEFQDLMHHTNINWHHWLSETAVRTLYQRSQVLLLPMRNSGANTAVVESLACGLPIVTTDVGGIRDYGGGTVYPVVAPDDDDAMIALVDAYLTNPNWRDEISKNSRKFAEEKLAWPMVAKKHLELYQELVV